MNSENTQGVVERAREEAKREYAPGLTLTAWERIAYIKGATFAATLTPEQVEVAARHLWASPFEHDPGDEDHAGTWEREDDWYRMLYRERAADLFRAAGFQIGTELDFESQPDRRLAAEKAKWQAEERERIAEALERRVIDNPTGDVAVALNEAYLRAARIAREETIR